MQIDPLIFHNILYLELKFLISKFHLNYVIFKNEILQNMKQFQVINFNLRKYEGSRN